MKKNGVRAGIRISAIFILLTPIIFIALLIYTCSHPKQKIQDPYNGSLNRGMNKEYDAGTQIKSEKTALNDNELLYKDVRVIMETSNISCLDLGVAPSGCLWVYTLDNGENRDGLAQTICYTAKKYGISCVTIFNQKQKELGRSSCN